MKYVKCLYSTEELSRQLTGGDFTQWNGLGYHRVTHNVIYKVFSLANCEENEFWIICDDSSKGRFRISETKKFGIYFVDATQELREEKLNTLGI